MVVINILPNIYWIYNNPNKSVSKNDFDIEVRKECEYLNIKTLVELDDKVSFWNNSKQYINEIKIEMEKNEFAKLLAILKKLNELIKNSYLTNNTLLISTYKNDYLELGLSIWIYFFNINANISFDNVIKLLNIKMIGNIILTDTLKKFFAYLNLSKISI